MKADKDKGALMPAVGWPQAVMRLDDSCFGETGLVVDCETAGPAAHLIQFAQGELSLQVDEGELLGTDADKDHLVGHVIVGAAGADVG